VKGVSLESKRKDLAIGIIIVLSFFILLLILIVGMWGLYGGPDIGISGWGKKVAIIEVYGVISNSSNVVRQLKKYSRDSSVPSIVLHINSPGGLVAPAQEIYEEIIKVREKGKKVVASLSSVAASGGYYVACAADTVVSNPGTLTGSIGVIFEFPVAEKLFKKIGLEFEVVKSGELKDVGTYSRRMTQKERKLLQELINDTYEQFVDVLVEQRGIPKKEVLKFADGRVFTGRQAQELGLVDVLGNLEDAIIIAGEMGGIEGPPDTIRERKTKITIFDLLTQKLDEWFNLENSKFMPQLQYIYR
jgi:protease-4